MSQRRQTELLTVSDFGDFLSPRLCEIQSRGAAEAAGLCLTWLCVFCRAAVEESYSKSMSKLAKMASNSSPQG